MNTVVVDFDGTLITGNSFPSWIIFILRKSVYSLKLKTVLIVLGLLIRRKVLKNITHIQLKERVDSLSYPHLWGAQFMKELKKSESLKVYNGIQPYTESQSKILVSTAAPNCYAKYIPEVFFPDYHAECITSQRLEDKTYFNNFQSNKAAKIKEIIGESEKFALFTDHSDDYELAKFSSQLYLCNPKEKHLKHYKESGLKFTILRDE